MGEAVQIDATATPPPAPSERPSRGDFAIGDTVSFEGRDLIQRLDTIVRINQKTAALSCDGHQWRVSFSRFFRRRLADAALKSFAQDCARILHVILP